MNKEDKVSLEKILRYLKESSKPVTINLVSKYTDRNNIHYGVNDYGVATWSTEWAEARCSLNYSPNTEKILISLEIGRGYANKYARRSYTQASEYGRTVACVKFIAFAMSALYSNVEVEEREGLNVFFRKNYKCRIDRLPTIFDKLNINPNLISDDLEFKRKYSLVKEKNGYLIIDDCYDSISVYFLYHKFKKEVDRRAIRKGFSEDCIESLMNRR